MKLVLEEYLKSLREKDELDILLCDLLLLDGYSVFNRPKTGERQYGVDILAQKETETYLFVIKQKNITRNSWDSGPDSVRQSLNDIFDVYLNTMHPIDRLGDRIHIVIVTNGYLQTAVQQNWTGYQKNHTYFNNIPLSYELWNIDDLVQLSSSVAFDETLFDERTQSLLRKTLYYMDEPDFSNKYFEQVVDSYIQKLSNSVDKPTQFAKIFTSFYTCTSLMNHWANDLSRYKIALDLSEYCLIKIWEFFYNNRFEDEKFVEWFLRFMKLYEYNNELFLEEIVHISKIKYGLMSFNTIENKLIIFEIAGRLSTYGLYLAYLKNVRKAQEITNILIELLNNNPALMYPIYDNNIIELSLVFLLMKQLGRKDLTDLIHMIVQGVIAQYKSKIIPAPNDSFEEALSIYFDHESPEYNASVLFGGLLEWTNIEQMEKEFNLINKFISTYFKNMTCQTWQMNINEELKLYSANAAYLSGVSVPFTKHDDFTEYQNMLITADKAIAFDDFSFNKYSFAPIAFICSRYFHFPVLPQFWRRLKKF